MKRIDIIKSFVENTPESKGVEVGVCEGHFSEKILQNWDGILYSVDPYRFYPEVKQDASNVSQEEHDKNYKEASERLSPYKDRSRLVVGESTEVAKQFKDEELAFVYLDARHDYRSVKADLEAWYPKIKIGGVIAGHDYFNADKYRHNIVEVKRAVDDFFFGERVWSTEEKRLPSWWKIKN